MMKKSYSQKFHRWWVVIIAVAAAVFGPANKARCQTEGPVLLLQVTPVEGGTVTPAEGVHRFELNTAVTLTATAKPGYQFASWLGDVSDPASNRTIVHLDAPKIVVAVFVRSEFELDVFGVVTQNAPVGGAFFTGVGVGQGGFGGPGGRRPRRFREAQPPEPEPPDDFPVPEDGDEFPVPVPEPATVVLLAGGSFLLRRRTPPAGRCQRGR